MDFSDIGGFGLASHEDVKMGIAKRFTQLRKAKSLSRSELSRRSAVAYASIARFEKIGEISLNSLVALCFALEVQDDLTNIFSSDGRLTLEELERSKGVKK